MPRNFEILARRRRRARPVLVLCCLAALSGACGSSVGGAIPVDKFPEEPEPATAEYIIGPGDVLNIQVFEQKEMSGQFKVRSDGRIALPLVGEIEVAGKPPATVSTELQNALKKLILVPQVTVSVEQTSPLSVSIIGEVVKSGPLELPRGSGVLQAIASAGGLTTFAHKDRIFVLRKAPNPVRIHFTYDALTSGSGRAVTFRLRSGDVINVQ